jgi:iron complex outermembrane receptor protein
MTHLIRKPVLVAACLAISMLASNVMAEEIEEIVVSAQKREQNIQDVGIAIDAFSAEDISRLNITNTSDIALHSPGVESREHFTSRGLLTNFFIRGVGTTDFNNATESAVTVYSDEFYLISSSTVDFSLMDVERAEVVKGPQGTLFGRNANGGAIQFFSNRPNFDGLSGAIEGGLGSDSIQQLQAHLNVPLSDSIAVRFAALMDDHGPFVKNVRSGSNTTGRDSAEQNFQAFRAYFLYRPSDSIDILYKFEDGKVDGRLGADQNIVTLGLPDGDVIAKPDNTNAYGYSPDAVGAGGPDKFDSEGFNSGLNDITSHLITIEVDVTDDISLTSITGFLNQNFKIYEDCDGTPSIICNYEAFYKSEHFTQEIRLNGGSDTLNWTAGVYYLNQDASGGLEAPLYFTADGEPDPSGTTPGQGYYADYDISVESAALYGQIEYAVSDSVTLIGGLRLSNEEKFFEEVYPVYNILTDNSLFPFRSPQAFALSSHTIVSLINDDATFTRENAGDLTKINDNYVSGTAQVNWQPKDNTLYYASYRRGVKAAGFNNGSVPTAEIQDQYRFDAEVLNAYELGAKWTVMNGRLRVNAATFYYDYDNYQTTRFRTLGILIGNADAKITGGEVEVIGSPFDGLDISLGLSLLDGKVMDISRGPGLPDRDFDLGEAPDVSANAMVRYTWPALGGEVYGQMSAAYVGERFTDAQNLTVAKLGAHTTVNAQFGWTSEDDKVYVQVWGRNITDDRVLIGALATLTFVNIGQANWNEKPTYGMKIGYRF